MILVMMILALIVLMILALIVLIILALIGAKFTIGIWAIHFGSSAFNVHGGIP